MRNVFVLLLCLCASCTEHQPETQFENDRIVSMSPGITQTLVDLGLEEMIVGRSPFCNGVDQSVPVIGDYHDVDFERLLSLKPTVVLVQATQAPKNTHLKELADSGLFRLHYWPLDSIDDITQVYNKASDIFSDSPKEFEMSVREVPLAERVLIVTQGSDVSAGLCFGLNTYLDDVIKSMGLENALEREGWAMLSLEDVANLQPDRILVVSDTPIKAESVKGIRSLNIPVLLFEHEHVLIPSSQVSNVATALQEQLVVVQ